MKLNSETSHRIKRRELHHPKIYISYLTGEMAWCLRVHNTLASSVPESKLGVTIVNSIPSFGLHQYYFCLPPT